MMCMLRPLMSCASPCTLEADESVKRASKLMKQPPTSLVVCMAQHNFEMCEWPVCPLSHVHPAGIQFHVLATSCFTANTENGVAWLVCALSKHTLCMTHAVD
jgi:hypothetical protein